MSASGCKVHLISGLPRSGSTLLSAILRQNPRFTASMTSPVCSLIGSVLPRMSGTSEFAPLFTDNVRHRVLESLFAAYHQTETLAPDCVVFDTNRTWTARMALAYTLFPAARVICCVREIAWVLDSIERLIRRHPTQVSRLFDAKAGRNVYSRCEALMDPDRGLVGLAWSALREAWFGERADQLIVLRYDSLVKDPAQATTKLYAALGEATHPHDFEHVEYEEEAYDQHFGLPGLHTVKRKVEFTPRPTLLPPDIYCKYADANFWETEGANTKGIMVL